MEEQTLGIDLLQELGFSSSDQQRFGEKPPVCASMQLLLLPWAPGTAAMGTGSPLLLKRKALGMPEMKH